MSRFTERLRKSWNILINRNQEEEFKTAIGDYVSTYRLDNHRPRYSNERTIMTSVFNRIALDVSAVDIEHVKVDSNGSYIETIDSYLNRALSVSANTDQTGREFIRDVVISMLDEGVVAIVPVDTSENPRNTESFDIYSLRCGRIIDWRPKAVKVEIYNEERGIKEQIIVDKRWCAIIENPLYLIMNEPNSILKRLIRKLNLLDVIDEQQGANKLDVIIQLPFNVKSPTRKEQAEQRRKDIENQLYNSKYGVAYIDATEHVTQLNRPVENTLIEQIKYLMELFYSQLGVTQTVLDGTADEATLNNYYARTLEPILTAITEEMRRKFLSRTAITQGQDIMYFRNPFKLIPVSSLADIADRFTRNEILTSNEFRGILGYAPSADPRADELVNKNIASNQDTGEGDIDEVMNMVNEMLDGLEGEINSITGQNGSGGEEDEPESG